MHVKKLNNQVISKKRVSDFAEVFTAEREVNAMLDLVKSETQRINSRFLEPACGTGNFLAEILKRKLEIVKSKYSKSQTEFERYAVTAVSSIYGVDILVDSVEDCRERLYQIFNEIYTRIFKKKCKEECRKAVKYILEKNIIWGDALSLKTPDKRSKPIIFSEWSAVNGSMIKRRDFMFSFLLDKSHQFVLFNDENNPAYIAEPVKEFPLVHFLKISQL